MPSVVLHLPPCLRQGPCSLICPPGQLAHELAICPHLTAGTEVQMKAITSDFVYVLEAGTLALMLTQQALYQLRQLSSPCPLCSGIKYFPLPFLFKTKILLSHLLLFWVGPCSTEAGMCTYDANSFPVFLSDASVHCSMIIPHWECDNEIQQPPHGVGICPSHLEVASRIPGWR